MEKASLEDLKVLIFDAFYFFSVKYAFYFLVLTFYQSNIIEYWKLSKCWSRSFCHCLKAAIIFFRHALTWFLDINKYKQFYCREIHLLSDLFLFWFWSYLLSELPYLVFTRL